MHANNMHTLCHLYFYTYITNGNISICVKLIFNTYA